MKRLLHLLEYAVLRGILLAASMPPRPAALALGRLLGNLVLALGVRRRVVEENLARAFPERTPSERRALARAVYAHFGAVLVDTATFHRWSEDDLRARTNLENYDLFREALATGRGVVLATAHLGCFDVGPGRIALEGPRITSVFQGVRNPYVERYITAIRTRGGARVAKRGIQFRDVIRALSAGECVTILGDQDAGPEGWFVSFLGVPASTLRGPAEFALRTGAVLMTGFVPLRDGRYTLVFEPPIAEDTTEGMMAEYVRRVERMVRSHPEQYFWLHRRWKTPPPAPREVAPAIGEVVASKGLARTGGA